MGVWGKEEKKFVFEQLSEGGEKTTKDKYKWNKVETKNLKIITAISRGKH